MLSTLLFVFLVWLPLATLLHTIVGSVSSPFKSPYKRGLYLTLAAPALASNWVLAILVRNQRTVDKLAHVGEWFKG